MTPAELEAFRARMGWNRRRLSHELEISQDRLRRMLAGGRIPRHIALACAALAMGLLPIGKDTLKVTPWMWADLHRQIKA